MLANFAFGFLTAAAVVLSCQFFAAVVQKLTGAVRVAKRVNDTTTP